MSRLYPWCYEGRVRNVGGYAGYKGSMAPGLAQQPPLHREGHGPAMHTSVAGTSSSHKKGGLVAPQRVANTVCE